MKASKYLSSIILGSSLIASPAVVFGGAKDKARDTAQSAMETVYDALDKKSTKVSFDNNKAELSESDRMQIQSLVRGAQDQEEVEKIYIFAWADRDFGKDKEFSDADKELASERIDAVKAYLDDLGMDRVETVNLADQPNWLQSTFGTRKHVLKEGIALRDKQYSDTDKQRTAEFARSIADKGGAGTAVLYVKQKDDANLAI